VRETPVTQAGKRAVRGTAAAAARLGGALAALAVSALPEQAKESGWPRGHASVAAHIVSGWVEALLSAGLFVLGFLDYGERFTHGTGWTYVSHRPTLTYGDFFGVGAIGYLSFLLTPLAWATVWCFGEGILRALDAAISSRMLGMALVAVPWRIAGALGRRAAQRALLSRLGPERPDEVAAGESGSGSDLVVWASREKAWAANQVIEYREEFFRLARRRLVKRGGRSAFRYDFRRLDHGEVIRGALVRYDPAGEPPAGAGGSRAAGG
jgi:hypothetical protein